MQTTASNSTTKVFSTPGSDPNKHKSDPNKLDLIGLSLVALLILGPMAAGALHLAS